MKTIAAFLAEKNKTYGSPFKMLIEIEYEPGSKLFFAKGPEAITWAGQLYVPFMVAPGNQEQTSQGTLSAYEITFQNAGREIQSICELYDIEGVPGRLVWVHPSHLSDPDAFDEEPFHIVSVRADRLNATFSVSPLTFDPLGVFLPAFNISLADFPGAGGTRFFVV